MRSKPRCFVLTLVLTAVLAPWLAACGSSSDAGSASDASVGEPALTQAAATEPAGTDTPTSVSAAFPMTIDAVNGPVTLGAQPGAIVSLSPTATEMLFAIGAGPQVTAVDDQSNYPAEAPITDLSGFEPNVEAIAAKQPDLVVVADDTAGLTASLGKLGIPVLSLPAAQSFDDMYQQIEQLGAATGNVGGAAELVGQMKTDIDAVVKSLPERATPLTYFHELDNTLYSATSKTFIGQVYGLLGLENIADAADPDGTGYPQLSQEFLIQANPDLIFLADTICCGQTAETVAARPGWDQLSAVQNGHVVPLSDDVVSRWGPRVVDFLKQAAAGVATVQPAPAG
ncbi:MAG TPA: ABC transporter substrate-binding protein [Acidimicrobiales bacterium]